MTRHDEWTDTLSDYLDDELGERERFAVEAHLGVCPACAETLASLQAVARQAAALASRPPATDLWDAIADRIAHPPAKGRRVAFTLPQLAAASVLLALFSGWLTVKFLPSTKPLATPEGIHAGAEPAASSASAPIADAVRLTDVQYDAAVADLQRALQQGRGRLDSETIKVVEQNLKVIDQAVDEARRALETDPANSYLNGYLMETRKHKLDVLRRAAALASESN